MPIPRRRFLELGAAAAATAVTGCTSSHVVPSPRPPRAPFAAFDGKIEHFIVLMLENRSYDHMLGALPGDEHAGVPRGTRLFYRTHDGSPSWVPIVHGAPPDRFSPDPGHGFQAVDAQIYGAGPDRPADMRGFAQRYVSDHPRASRAQMEHYATLYGEGHLPVLQRLALEYGVCTHWFCSVPSATTPNRMFAHAGTSGGATGPGAYYSCINGRMIFDALGDADQRAWRVYFHDLPHLWLAGDAWTKAFGGHFQRIGAFARDVRDDRLATYTFIEPQHVIPPWSSQHPSAGVSHGEGLIARLYDTLVSNPRVFEKSLFLVVYDEHGGFYDHVIPPGHPGWHEQCPDIDYEVVRPDGVLAKGRGHEKGYAFDTLGPRVPAVVVSPWIERGSVFGWNARDPERRVTFDHTSILATVGAMTGVWVESKRARAAANLGVAINRTSPRVDYPSTIPFDWRDYRENGVLEDLPLAGADANADEGVAGELRAAWRAEHGDPADPREMVEHFQTLVGD
jgi:phospholipase C